MKPRSNWRLIFLTMGASWSLVACVVYASSLRYSASFILPTLFFVSGLSILVIHGVIGSIRQRQWEIESRSKCLVDPVTALHQSAVCQICGSQTAFIRLVIYNAYIYLIFVTIQRNYAEYLCKSCANDVLSRWFRRNVMGCILFPPYILWAAICRRNILRSYDQEL